MASGKDYAPVRSPRARSLVESGPYSSNTRPWSRLGNEHEKFSEGLTLLAQKQSAACDQLLKSCTSISQTEDRVETLLKLVYTKLTQESVDSLGNLLARPDSPIKRDSVTTFAKALSDTRRHSFQVARRARQLSRLATTNPSVSKKSPIKSEQPSSEPTAKAISGSTIVDTEENTERIETKPTECGKDEEKRVDSLQIEESSEDESGDPEREALRQAIIGNTDIDEETRSRLLASLDADSESGEEEDEQN